ncbi:MAG: ceramidase domain-containing protein [Pseudomonadota bacterium]
MDLFAQVDIYCERIDPSFWAEPLNAVSNAAFLIAALWGAYVARSARITHPAIWCLIGLAACIGIGSFLFHTHATVWASLADVIPIWSFVATYAVVSVAIIGKAPPRSIAIGIVLIIIAGTLLYLFVKAGAQKPDLPRTPSRFNGSEQYLPAIFLMVIFSTIALIKRHPIRYWFLSATLIFFISLAFRTFDMAVCDNWPYGTHFMWHMLNGIMIALLLQALIRNTQRTTTP